MDRTKQLHVYIKPELHKLLKIEAAKQGRSITDLLEEMLEKEIEKLPKRYVLHNNTKAERLIFFERKGRRSRASRAKGIRSGKAGRPSVRQQSGSPSPTLFEGHSQNHYVI